MTAADDVIQRAQKTIGVWRTFQTNLEPAGLKVDEFEARVAQIDVLRRAVLDAEGEWKATVAQIKALDEWLAQINRRMTLILDGTLEDDAIERGNLERLKGLRMQREDSNLERAGILVPLWAGVNQTRAAQSPPLPPLMAGQHTQQAFVAALERRIALLSERAHKRGVWQNARRRWLAMLESVDRDSKRWYRIWSALYLPGSAESDALSLVPTLPSGRKKPDEAPDTPPDEPSPNL